MTIEIDGNKLEYEFVVDEDTGERHVVIKRGREAKGDLAIPAMIDGCPVTEIGDFSFFCCAALTSVSIPDGVTYIGHVAFRSCTGLTSIGTQSFCCCHGLKQVVIPESVACIECGAFWSCSGLEKADVPSQATIGENAFDGTVIITRYIEKGKPELAQPETAARKENGNG